MQLHRVHGLALAMLAACAADSQEQGTAEGFEFEPGLFVPLTGPDAKADLPNAEFYARGLDTSGYRNIASKFVEANMDVKLTGAEAKYDWPLADSRAVLNRQGTPIRLGYDVYEHTGLDILRQSETESAVVHAPTSGTALVTDWWGQNSFPNGDYSTVISIWDPMTHHVLQIMHIKPDPMIPRTGFFEVQRGQVLGELAEIGIAGGRHVHVNVIDAEHFELVDPVTVMPSYPDTTKPVIGEVYLLDAMTARHPTLQTGPLDLVVTAHDRDDSSPRNLEINRVAFTAKDQLGNELARLEPCRLSDAFKVLAYDWSMYASTIRMIDFGNAKDQYGGFWPSSDLGNPDRLFRYALTNLRVGDGGCTIVANDRDGQLEISAETTELTVTIDLWDARGNQETKEIKLTRDGDQTPGALVINEVLADPPAGYDASGDGIANTISDEMIELVNVGGSPLDLGGATIADNIGVRVTIPMGTVLAPGGVLVVFGGGVVGNAVPGVTYHSSGTLALNNGGDTITVALGDTVLATASYGTEGGRDESLVRATELDDDSPFVGHTTVSTAPASPGTRANGSSF